MPGDSRHRDQNPDVEIVCSRALNPNVCNPAYRILDCCPRIHLLEPLRYGQFAHLGLVSDARVVLTDSGGIQEEAPALGKPTLVLRETTERPEAIEAGTAILVGADRERIAGEAARLLHDPAAYAAMAKVAYPFGDGKAAQRIADIILAKL